MYASPPTSPYRTSANDMHDKISHKLWIDKILGGKSARSNQARHFTLEESSAIISDTSK